MIEQPVHRVPKRVWTIRITFARIAPPVLRRCLLKIILEHIDPEPFRRPRRDTTAMMHQQGNLAAGGSELNAAQQ